MRDPSAAEVHELRMPSVSPSPIETALRVGAAIASCSAAYSDVLRTTVLANPLVALDQAEALKFCKILDDDEAQQILLVIWRESSFVDEGCLKKIKLVRQFKKGRPTVYGLATKIAESTEMLAATIPEYEISCSPLRPTG